MSGCDVDHAVDGVQSIIGVIIFKSSSPYCFFCPLMTWSGITAFGWSGLCILNIACMVGYLSVCLSPCMHASMYV